MGNVWGIKAMVKRSNRLNKGNIFIKIYFPFRGNNCFDIVFHVGGINFFNDKARAIREMLRVAKPGSKIMIADETSDFIERQYKKSGFTRRYFADTHFDLGEIENSIPADVGGRRTRLLWDNRFYCITFRKPC